MALLKLEQAAGEQPDPCCGCAGCRARATRRLCLTIGRARAALVPLCTGHAEDVRHQHWAMQVEDDWGGSLLDGRQVPIEPQTPQAPPQHS